MWNPVRQLSRLTPLQWLLLSGACVLTGVFLFRLQAGSPAPSYQGRTAEQWWKQYLMAAPSYYERDKDWGDRYEAALAFRAMGSNGTRFLIERSLQDSKTTLGDRLAKTLPRPAYDTVFGPEHRQDEYDRSVRASFALREAAPPVGEILGCITQLSHSTNILAWEPYLHLLMQSTEITNAVFLPMAMQWAASTNEAVRFYGFRTLNGFVKEHSREIWPLVLDDLQGKRRHKQAYQILVSLSEVPPEAIPVLESMRQCGEETTEIHAAIALLHLAPTNQAALVDVTNALLDPKQLKNIGIERRLQQAGTNALAMVPYLAALSWNPDKPAITDTNTHTLWALEAISKTEAIATLERRLGREPEVGEDLGYWFADAGWLIRIGPPESQARALEALETRYADMLQQSGWESWRVELVQRLKPDEYDHPPPDSLIQFVRRVASNDPDAEVRRNAGQALKYFRLRWGK